MTRGRTKDIAAAIRQRLLNRARASGRPFNELLQYYGMERFLYRLSKSAYSNNFVLKGALMFNVWTAFAQDTAKQSQWRGFRRRNLPEDSPENLTDVVAFISTFLGPATEATVLGKPFNAIWKHPGPWKAQKKGGT
ncbi:MAG: hypothetical protein V2B18_11835 [Pseudomonadota bacterium]